MDSLSTKYAQLATVLAKKVSQLEQYQRNFLNNHPNAHELTTHSLDKVRQELFLLDSHYGQFRKIAQRYVQSLEKMFNEVTSYEDYINVASTQDTLDTAKEKYIGIIQYVDDAYLNKRGMMQQLIQYKQRQQAQSISSKAPHTMSRHRM